jgi:hypothetical protein
MDPNQIFQLPDGTYYRYDSDGPVPVSASEAQSLFQQLPAAGSGRLVDQKYYTDQDWGNTGINGGDTDKWRSPTGQKGRLVMGPNGPMFELPSDAQFSTVKDTSGSALGGIINPFQDGSLANFALRAYGMYQGVNGLGNLYNTVTSSIPTGGTTNTTALNTTTGGTNVGDEWNWVLDNEDAMLGQAANTGADLGATMPPATPPSYAVGDGFGDVPFVDAAGNPITPPSGYLGSNVYGNPDDILKNIFSSGNPIAKLITLFGSGGIAEGLNKLISGADAQSSSQGGYQFPWANAISAYFGYQGQKELADKILEGTKYAVDKADPFASQRGFYQDQLKSLYTNPSQMLNNPLFTAARDQATNAAQRAYSAKGYHDSTNELNGIGTAATNASLQHALPYMQQTATNAGATFGPGASGQIAQAGTQAAAQATNNANGALGYGFGQIMQGNQPSMLESIFGTQNKNQTLPETIFGKGI